MERLEQICGDDFEVTAKNILFSEPYSFEEQERLIDKAIKITENSPEVGLIVIDSVTMHYRLTLRDEIRRDERHALTRQIAKLLRVSRKVGIPVIATSQVYTDIETGKYLPLGGHMLTHSAKTILELLKTGPSARLPPPAPTTGRRGGGGARRGGPRNGSRSGASPAAAMFRSIRSFIASRTYVCRSSRTRVISRVVDRGPRPYDVRDAARSLAGGRSIAIA